MSEVLDVLKPRPGELAACAECVWSRRRGDCGHVYQRRGQRFKPRIACRIGLATGDGVSCSLFRAKSKDAGE